ncbi:MAG: glycoside hydrolase family 9 protein, partial [Candidatus Hydrogenedentes bacterium]|nr:glycoside hydrolase family 9 protein [Candidatus Hydrogenedentota bacterium]
MLRRPQIGLAESVIAVVALAAWPAWPTTLFTLGPEITLPIPAIQPAQAAWEPGAGPLDDPVLRITTSSRAGVSFLLFDAPRPLAGPGDYRIETWAKLAGGTGRIEVVVYQDQTGAGGRRYGMLLEGGAASKSTVEDASTDWQYYAREVPIHGPARQMWYNIRISVHGRQALLRRLRLNNSASLLVSGEFDQRDPLSPVLDDPAETGALSLPRGWRRSYASGDTGGQAIGRFGIEQRGDGNVLVVQKQEGAFVLSAEPVAVPHDALSYVARAHIEPSSEPPLLLVRQYGVDGMLKESPSASVGEDVISTEAIPFVRRAERLVLLVRFPRRQGTYCLRKVELICREQRDPRPKILLDQVGYETGGAVRFIVESEVFSRLGTFALESPQRTYKGRLVPLGRTEGQQAADWGRYYFEGRVEHAAAGAYRLSVKLNGQKAGCDSVMVAPERYLAETAELAYRFYSVQRCGCAVPGWHGVCHLDDGRLPDGSHVDVSGGYHNAGDYHKHMDDNTPVSIYAMISAYESQQGFFDALDRDGNGQADILDEATWGAEWLLKMIDPKTGHSWRNVTNDIDYWGIPERDTDNAANTSDDRVVDTSDPGDLGAWNIASWAALARHVPGTRYAEAAANLWAVGEQNLVESRNPRALIAALELYRTTHEERYAQSAERILSSVLPLQNAQGWFAAQPGGDPQFRIVDEGTIPAALALYVLAWPKTESSRAAKESLGRYFRWSVDLAANPFGIIRHHGGEDLFYFKNRKDWFGGSNSAYCSTAWAARLAAKVFQADPEFSALLREHAANQVHWILGLNPLGFCMFEGKGDSFRIRYHHTYSTVPGQERGAVPGAIPNGITRDPSNYDRPWFDLRSAAGSPVGAESAEPWLPHNAYYLLML